MTFHTSRIVAAALVSCAMALTACTSSPSGTSASPSAVGSGVVLGGQVASSPAAPTRGETAELAAELVPVPGYAYVDVPAAERTRELAAMPPYISGASMHVVTAEGSPDEVAFLILSVADPGDAMHATDDAQTLARNTLSTENPSQESFSGQSVWFAEDASRPSSRYRYCWDRHGTIGWADGPDRARVEAFLTAYFAVPFRGAETSLLSERMVAPPGYSFTNATDQPEARLAAYEEFPGARDASVHHVFDREHSFGGLTLVGPVTSMTDDEILAAVKAWAARTNGVGTVDITDLRSLSSNAVAIRRFTDTASGIDYFVWRWPDTDVVGWLATTRPDIGTDFVTPFVAAPPVR